jgi:hypothetical protein
MKLLTNSKNPSNNPLRDSEVAILTMKPLQKLACGPKNPTGSRLGVYRTCKFSGIFPASNEGWTLKNLKTTGALT